jgi:CheY-like chemotaxis protein/glycine cleavage system H lipoate-binding protein
MNTPYDILIVDDEQVVIDAVKRICSVEGMKVDEATDASLALNKVAKNRYRLIICDIMLPGMDGFQLLEELKPLDSSTAVIMTTGYTTIENAVRALFQGAVDFLPKPFTSEEFCSSIKRALNYISIRKEYIQKKAGGTDQLMLFVPCPAKYFRFGYGSWLVQDHNGSVRIGVTDLFLKTIAPVTKISLQEKDRELFQGNACAMLDAEDGMQHPVLSPVSGRILTVNSRIETEPDLLEKDPFFEGWLYRLIPDDLAYQMKYLIPGGTEEL